MICTKCGNDIPDGAKFCPSCGAASQAAPEKKLYCEKCGLELMNGAKFCSVCGGTGVMRGAEPSDGMSAAVVDLNKPSQSDSLVSAMNGVSAAADSAISAPIPGVPMPSNDVPTPSNDVPVPSGSSPASSGYAPSDAMPVIPPFVASASANVRQAPIVTPVPTASGAAVSTKRIGGGKIALFAALGVLLIAIAAAAIMFATNRATFLSTFMGKEKYATMVEGNSIKNATEKLDIPAIANGIKAASGTYQAMSTTMGDSANPFLTSGNNSYVSGSRVYLDTSAAGPVDPEFNAGFNVSELSEMLAETLQSYYGANTINETLTVNVQLSDSVKAMLGAGEIDVDKYLDLINGTSVNYTLSAKDDKTAIALGADGQFTVNAEILLDGQDVYIALPFASGKAVMISVPASSESVKTEAKPLELDEKELERLITECVEIYLDHYKAASIEMENGEIKAADVTVNGKLIAAEFKGEQLSKLFSDIAEHIVKDDYLMTQIADYANSCGAEITKQELIDDALDGISDTFSDINDSDRLVINTVIDRSGNVLGKSVKAMGGDEVFAEFAYADTTDRLGFEMSDDMEFTLRVTVDKIDDKSGACNITVTDGEDEGSFILNYSNVKKTEFCGKEICTGDFSFGMKMPESFADQLGKDAWAAINGAKLNLGLAADSQNTLETNIAIEVPSYGSVSLKDVFTVSNDEPEFKKPADVIDITDAMLSGMPDEATMAELEKLGEDITNAFKNAVPEFIKSDMEKFSAGSLIGGNDGPNVYPGSGSLNDDVADLLGDIQYDMDDIQKALNGEIAYDTDYITSSELEALLSDYTNLYLEIIVKGNAITENELDAFYDRYWDLYMELPYFEYENNDYYFDDPRLNALSENFTDSYIAALNIENYYSDKLSDNPEATALYNDVENACSELLNYFESTGADDLDEYTEAQLAETERLLGILDEKINAFMAKYNFQ